MKFISWVLKVFQWWDLGLWVFLVCFCVCVCGCAEQPWTVREVLSSCLFSCFDCSDRYLNDRVTRCRIRLLYSNSCIPWGTQPCLAAQDVFLERLRPAWFVSQYVFVSISRHKIYPGILVYQGYWGLEYWSMEYWGLERNGKWHKFSCGCNVLFPWKMKWYEANMP